MLGRNSCQLVTKLIEEKPIHLQIKLVIQNYSGLTVPFCKA